MQSDSLAGRVIITIAYRNQDKFYRIYKDGEVRAEVPTEKEAKRLAELLKQEKNGRLQ
jgi:hypothetical protein